MKQEIQVFDYAKEITQALPKGVLLTTRVQDKVNSMTIGWGTLGVVWGEPVFIVFVREGRFTREQLDASGEFTVNIPYGSYDRKILGYCGAHSGRDTDKIRDLGLTLVDADLVKAPAIRELPLTLECKVIYRQHQEAAAIPPAIPEKYHPQDVEPDFHGRNRDFHTAYYGEIVSAYILE